MIIYESYQCDSCSSIDETLIEVEDGQMICEQCLYYTLVMEDI